MISKQHNCIFIHIPKTGGSSIEAMIWPKIGERTEKQLWMGFVRPHYNKYQTGGLQHLLAWQVKEETGVEFFTQSLKFSMTRNPWDKAVSQYAYMCKREDLRNFIGMKKDTPFIKYLELITKKEHVQWIPQYKFLVDENGEVLVDKILKFEHFNNDVSALLQNLNINVHTIEHRNRGERGHYGQYYTQETKELVGEIYAHDIELFDYEYDDTEQFTYQQHSA